MAEFRERKMLNEASKVSFVMRHIKANIEVSVITQPKSKVISFGQDLDSMSE